MNNQPMSKVDYTGTGVLVHSIFHTIQGEGPFSGRPAVFVRLGGCNLQCPGCDTEYTEGSERMEEFLVACKAKGLSFHSTTLCVITGGEPFRQDISKLVTELLLFFKTVQIETNGTLPVSAGLFQSSVDNRIRMGFAEPGGVYIVVSPKTDRVHETIRQWACAWKYVIDSTTHFRSDFLPCTSLKNKVGSFVARPLHPGALVYLTPMDTGNPLLNKANRKMVASLALKTGYIAQIQLHKELEIE